MSKALWFVMVVLLVLEALLFVLTGNGLAFFFTILMAWQVLDAIVKDRLHLARRVVDHVRAKRSDVLPWDCMTPDSQNEIARLVAWEDGKLRRKQ